MSDLIEGMAKAIAAVNSTPAKRGDWQDFVLDAQAAFAFLADPRNITPEMVEAARAKMIQANAVERTFSGVVDRRSGIAPDYVRQIITAALTAAKEA